VDAARLSGAKLRVFSHNDLNHLEQVLKRCPMQPAADGRPDSMFTTAGRGAPRRTLIVTESLFSMDGDQAPLHDLVELKDRYGAWLMVDEAHATGLYGPRRRGLAEVAGVSERIEIQMGTLGKALGAAGGYVAGSRALVELLVNRARSFIFSTAPVPAATAAASAGLSFVRSDSGAKRCAELWARVEQFTQGVKSLRGLASGAMGAAQEAGKFLNVPGSAINPLIVGAESAALAASTELRAHGVFVPAIRFPTVARGQARLRITLTAAHTVQDVDELLAALQRLDLTPQTDSTLRLPHSNHEQSR
jgi:7-keto-8-aminopelargonate synthetase-like enzyme